MSNEFEIDGMPYPDNLPNDVCWVWAIQMSGHPVGLDTFNKIQEIIKNNPKYFPWETKYNEIPEEVHQAYLNEVNPDRFKIWEPINIENMNEGILDQIDRNLPPSSFYTSMSPITEKDINDFLKEMMDKERKRKEEQQKEENRIKKIWNKHYKKYKLPYPKKYSFQL